MWNLACATGQAGVICKSVVDNNILPAGRTHILDEKQVTRKGNRG